jgi:hypothetical protein
MPARRKRKSDANSDPKSLRETEILWVMENLSSTDKPSSASERDAPSPQAWNLLRQFDVDHKSRMAFSEKFYRDLHKKEKQESAVQFADDRRKFFRLFDLLETKRPDFLNDNFPRSPSRPEPVVESVDGVRTTDGKFIPGHGPVPRNVSTEVPAVESAFVDTLIAEPASIASIPPIEFNPVILPEAEVDRPAEPVIDAPIVPAGASEGLFAAIRQLAEGQSEVHA